MTPEGTQRFRAVTSWLAIAWAVLALFLSIWGQVTSPRTVEPPIHTTSVGGAAVVGSASPEALAAGIELGSLVLEVDGIAIEDWYRQRGWERVSLGKPVRYKIEAQEGHIFEVELPTRERQSIYEWLAVPVFAALSVVGVVFVMVGLFVWRLRPGSFGSVGFPALLVRRRNGALQRRERLRSTARLRADGHEPALDRCDDVPPVHDLPTEPRWIARRRQLRLLPYAVPPSSRWP